MRPFAWGLLCVMGCAQAQRDVEVIVLTPRTWDDAAPAGKEVDAIYGDLVLRNDRITAVIANPVPGRYANLGTGAVGGQIIDLTTREDSNDQLVLFHAGGKGYPFTLARREAGLVRVEAPGDATRPAASIEYALAPASPWVLVTTTYTNTLEKELPLDLVDVLRAERTFEQVPPGKTDLVWVHDKWWGQAYGLSHASMPMETKSDAKQTNVTYGKVALKPGETLTLSRRLFPGRSLIDVKSIAAGGGNPVGIIVEDVGEFDVLLRRDGQPWASARSSRRELRFDLPLGTYEAEVSAFGSDSRKTIVNPSAYWSEVVKLDKPGWVDAEISDASGGPIPCKVQFKGRDGTKDPFFFPDSGDHSVHNLFYSESGRFRRTLPPGAYDAIVSRGPEYDAVFTSIQVEQGRGTPLKAVLKRTVDTTGWVSADFHSHSSPSGDNVGSQFGRVLNLLAEHIEFGPCTEHNRISTYEDHLKRLGATARMATCSGIELTGQPLPINHQNAFPMKMTPRTQDNGGPRTDADPVVQIERLALWDDKSDKLVQQNHPDLIKMFFDKNDDGKADGGFSGMAAFMDVVEVHPPGALLRPPEKGRNAILGWMVLLNQGRRIPGVVNTDAHYNHHGSGWLRNYIKSPTDDPAAIRTLDIVHASERGHLVMTNGPFLEVALVSGEGPGDDARAPGGMAELRVRVQAPNWFDVDRVQVFLNGRPEASLNFTRALTPDRFGSGTVKFDQRIPLKLAEDAHVIVAAAGESSTLGLVMGPEAGKAMPIAVSNPIFVDVDGGGFKPNGDELGVPLPAGR